MQRKTEDYVLLRNTRLKIVHYNLASKVLSIVHFIDGMKYGRDLKQTIINPS